MDYRKQNIDKFIEDLGSNSATPGGGGASALVCAIGASLASMVINLTIGKKAYVEVEEEMEILKTKIEDIQKEALDLIEKDAQMFEPLSQAYKLPKQTDEEKIYKEKVMEESLEKACMVPIKIMQISMKAIEISEILLEKGSRLALSDAGCAISICWSAMQSASYSVYINTKLMKNRKNAEDINKNIEDMLYTTKEKVEIDLESLKEKLK